MLSGLLVKHYLADFVMQPHWMLSAKGRLDAPGGYAHAAVHAVGSGIVLLACGIGAAMIFAVMLAAAATTPNIGPEGRRAAYDLMMRGLQKQG